MADNRVLHQVARSPGNSRADPQEMNTCCFEGMPMRFVSIFLVVLVMSCAGPQAALDGGMPSVEPIPAEPDAGTSGIEPCRRYEERLGGRCLSVKVTGVVSQPLNFTRAGYTLNGTVVRPTTQGDYRAPGVVLVHGSGPNDRDESLSGSLGVAYGQLVAVFQLLAEKLAQQGMVVYRYDKRTCFKENSSNRCPNPVANYVGSIDGIFTSDYVLDARAALQELARQPWVDAQDLTVIGHSEGANFIPLIVKDEPGVIAGVQLAGASESIDKVIVGQLRDLANYLEQANSPQYASTISNLRSEANRYEGVLQQIQAGTYPQSRFEGATVEQWKEWIQHTSSLRAEFQAVTKPIFVLNGEFDFNVAPRHLQQFRQWSTEVNMSNARFLLLPNVTHAFLTLNEQKTSIDFNFSPTALSAIAEWHRDLTVSH